MIVKVKDLKQMYSRLNKRLYEMCYRMIVRVNTIKESVTEWLSKQKPLKMCSRMAVREKVFMKCVLEQFSK